MTYWARSRSMRAGWCSDSSPPLHHFPSPARSVGEGGRRPDEGSSAQRALISTSILAETKSPHPPFGHPLPLLRNGRGETGGIAQDTPFSTVSMKGMKPAVAPASTGKVTPVIPLDKGEARK